jgi:predicted transcriptional regulator
MQQEAIITLTADIVSSHVANNKVEVNDVPRMVQLVHDALADLGQPQEKRPAEKVPVVSVRASVKPDHIVCMECGKKQKMLKRHLQTAHGMSADEYRKDYGLPADYPMVAPNYSDQRRDLAKAIGLGRKKNPSPVAPKKPRRGRSSKKASAGPISGDHQGPRASADN